VIQPLLPNKPHGFPRVEDRRVLNGIFWRLRTGAPRVDIPERYGPHLTCVNRFNQWRRAGVWDRLLEAVSRAYEGDIHMVDLSRIRVHQHAANTQKRTPITLPGSLAGRPDGENPRARRRGRPADRAQPMPNRRNVSAFGSFLYRYRNLVERFFNKLKHFRAVATRCDNSPENYLASVKLASARKWMRVNETTAPCRSSVPLGISDECAGRHVRWHLPLNCLSFYD
jgi:transposase